MRRRQFRESLFDQAELRSYRNGRLSELVSKVEELERDVSSLPDRLPTSKEDREVALSKANDARLTVSDARSVINDADGRMFDQYIAEAHRYLSSARAVFQEHVVKQKELAREHGKRGGRGHTADEPRSAGHPHAEGWAREVEAIMSRNGSYSRADAYKRLARSWKDVYERNRSWTTIRDAVNAYLRKK